MKYNPAVHHRRSIRLKEHDYAGAGEYFLTFCTHERACLFGSIENELVKLSDFGEIVKKEWLRTALLRSDVGLDDYIIMPNHMHAVIALCRGTSRRGISEVRKGGEVSVGAYGNTPLREPSSSRGKTPFRSPSCTVGAIIRGFKAASTKRINELRRAPGAPVWQRNYYEHVIRDEKDLERIRDYIRLNPTRWLVDDENPVKSSNVLNDAS